MTSDLLRFIFTPYYSVIAASLLSHERLNVCFSLWVSNVWKSILLFSWSERGQKTVRDYRPSVVTVVWEVSEGSKCWKVLPKHILSQLNGHLLCPSYYLCLNVIVFKCHLTRPVTLTNKDIGDIFLILDAAEGIKSLAIFSVANDIIQFLRLFFVAGNCNTWNAINLVFS